MLNINSIGRSFIVDKPTGFVIAIAKSNEIAKFVSSTFMDCFAVQVHDYRLKNIDPSYLTNDKWLTYHSGQIKEHNNEVIQQFIDIRKIANLRRDGCQTLYERILISECSYDNLSDLNSENLVFYLLNKDIYINEYAKIKSISAESAKKHLNFLADNLIDIKLRSQIIFWKFSNTLKNVSTPDDLVKWKDSLFLETVGIGAV